MRKIIKNTIYGITGLAAVVYIATAVHISKVPQDNGIVNFGTDVVVIEGECLTINHDADKNNVRDAISYFINHPERVYNGNGNIFKDKKGNVIIDWNASNDDVLNLF